MLDNSSQSLAYQKMRDAIIHCEYVPGQKLSTRELEETFQLGRTPIREALVMLSVQGLIYTVPQSGTYVSKIDLSAASDLLFIRERIETSVVVESCARANDEGLTSLRATLDDEQAAIDNRDALAFFNCDNRFHDQLYQIADRVSIREWLNESNTHLERFRWLRTQVMTLDWTIIQSQHEDMYAAICERDTEQASYLCSVHLHLMDSEKDAVVAAFPDYFK